jgi:PAS domain S-box-containing protein
MWGKTSRLDLSRRVVGYYLMFGLAAIIWLALGSIYVAEQVMEKQSEKECFTHVGEAAGAAREIGLKQSAALQELVRFHCDKWSLAYCAVADADGTILAHSTVALAGNRRVAPNGETACWGDIQRTRFIAEDSGVLREYQAPIRQGSTTVGTLLLAVPDGGNWRQMIAAADYAPTAFMVPLIFVVLGAVAMHRSLNPVAKIEKQLRRMSGHRSVDPGDFQSVPATTEASVGWNRLVESYNKSNIRESLDNRMSQALEKYRFNKLDQILNSLADGIAVTDEHDRITFANRALAGLLGMAGSEADLLGKTIDECLSLSTDRQAAPLSDPGQRGRMVVAEIGRGGDMSRGVLRVSRSPQCSSQTEHNSSCVWSIRDVTQQKLADQMREQFVNAATHELRTPLANIKAYAETLVLSEMMDVEQQKSFCNTINEEVTRLSRFVDDLLYLSRMEVGSTPLNLQITGVERLLRETVAKTRPLMEQKSISFEIELPAKLPELVLDKDKFTVALVNLLGNAAKYTPNGGQVRMRVDAKDRALQIDVEDTGIGVSVEELPKILDKFFRSSDPRVQEQTGSGLGLSLANEIVRLHGGKLTVQSQLNKGSRFTIVVPMVLEKNKCSNA